MAKAIDTGKSCFPDIPRLLVAGLTLSLGACGSFVHDSAPRHDVDVSRIKDPVPRHEPRARYGNPDSYVVNGKTYRVKETASGYYEKGIASWYGTKFHGRRTSNGETYNMYEMTAAHKSLPIPVYVEVTNLQNGRTVVVRVNDRGPFVDGRIIDLSYAAAKKLGIHQTGTAPVSVRALHPGQKPSRPTEVATAPVTVPAPAAQVEPLATETTPPPAAQVEPLATETTPPPAELPARETVQASAPAAMPGAAAISAAPADNMADLAEPIKAQGQLYLQVGAFSEHYNAARLLLRLLALTSENVIINRNSSGGQEIYRVRIGPLASENTARELGSQLIELGISASRVIVD